MKSALLRIILYIVSYGKNIEIGEKKTIKGIFYRLCRNWWWSFSCLGEKRKLSILFQYYS